MKAKKTIKFAILLCGLALSAFSQDHGIHFEKGADWQQVLLRAKAEHKYIFVDCYATWCGPCKQMDAVVYTLKEVGDVYNRQFISVKLQMDRTANDDANTKSVYFLANSFTNLYHITGYPTFLFFDPDHQIVHKVTGSFGVKGFLQLAKDAQNPKKQYYVLAKNFRPGKLDTAEEKSLAQTFYDTDQVLGGKMALDYLTRIPNDKPMSLDNMKLIVLYQNNGPILNVALTYLQHLPKPGFEQKSNLSFIVDLQKHPEILTIVTNHEAELNETEFSKPINLALVKIFKEDSKIQALARNYLLHLTKDQLYTKDNISFLSVFTMKPADYGFNIFHHDAEKVDAVMKGKGYARSVVQKAIDSAEFETLFENAKQSGTTPDFENIRTSITKHYTADYAERIIVSGKVKWYGYLIGTKKENKYWPEFIDSRITQIKTLRYDTLSRGAAAVGLCNSICYTEMFLHCDNPEQLDYVAGWQRKMIESNLSSHSLYEITDTYACLLYKAGKVDDAVQWEQKALAAAKANADKYGKTTIDNCALTVEKMKRGEQIWLEPEYQ